MCYRIRTLLKNPTFRFTVRSIVVLALGIPLLAVLVMHYRWGAAARAAFERVKQENAVRNAGALAPAPMQK